MSWSRWPVVMVAAAAAVAACQSGDPPEALGDRAYGAGRFEQAVRQYRTASSTTAGGRLWAKLGAAALHAGDFKTASDAYRRLAAEDPTRADEAAEGLEAVARGADRAGDLAALHDAVLGLRAVAPGRPIARYVLALARRSGLSGAEAVTLLPAALAAAPDAGTFDSLLTAYGAALQASGACDQAAPAFRAALRRSRESAVRVRAGTGLATCGLGLGIAALAAGRSEDAVHWFAQAAQVDSSSWTGRRALLGLGDARLSQGDVLAAAIAFQGVLAQGTPSDSLGRIAADRLRMLGAPVAPMPPPADTGRRKLP